MHFIGKLLSTLLLKVSLSILIVSSTAFYLVSTPALIKSSLVEANVYNDVVPAIFETIDSDMSAKSPGQKIGDAGLNPSSDRSPFSDPVVRDVIRESIDPAVLQTQVDGAIEAFSNWLQGSSRDLQFTMDFQPIKTTLSQNLTDYAAARVQSLPVCTASDASVYANGTGDADDQDVFSIRCRPENFSTAEVSQKINEQLADMDFKITQDTFTKDGQAPLNERLVSVKQAYGLLKLILTASAIATTVAVGLFILAHRPLKSALYALGHSLLTSGLLILVPVAISYVVIPKIIDSMVKEQKVLASVGAAFAETYAHKVLFILLLWGIGLTVGGVVLMIVDRKRTAASPNVGGDKTRARK